MKINGIYSDITIDVNFEDSDKECIFLSPSGTGKTFLFGILIEYLREMGITAVLINSTLLNNLHNDITNIEKSCLDNDVQIVILDNADLYLTQEFLDALLEHGKKVIISLKNESRFSFQNFGFYRVKYSEKNLNVRRKL